MTTALNYYGKGIAYAALGDHEAAAEAQSNFEKTAATLVESRMIHVVTCEAILGVAREMLAGEVNYHKGNYDAAFIHLRKAVELEDALPYDEPWGWMMPIRCFVARTGPCRRSNRSLCGRFENGSHCSAV